MKKSLSFVLVLALVFGSFSFAFAGSVSGGINTAYQTKDYLKTNYIGPEDINQNITYDGIDMTGYDFVVVKQATSLIIWTEKAFLDEADKEDFIKKLEAHDKISSLGIPESTNTTYYFTDNSRGDKYLGSKSLGEYYFNVPGEEILIVGDGNENNPGLTNHVYALANGISHYILGTFNEIPSYDVEYTINKDVVVSGGAFVAKTFNFEVSVSGISSSAIKPNKIPEQITIEPGEESDNTKFDLSGLKAEDFPLRLEFKENNASGDGWICDNNTSYSVDVTLDNGIVTYGPLVKAGDVDFVSANENEVTFTNYFDGDYQLQFPIQKIATISSGAFTSKTFEFKAELVSDTAVSATKSITILSDGSDSLSGSGILELAVQTLPAMVQITETTADGEGWICDKSEYTVSADDVNEDGVVEYTCNGKQKPWSAATFNNTYAGPEQYSFPIEITKNLLDVPSGMDMGDLTFEFGIVVKDKNGLTIGTTTAATTFTSPYTTSKKINLDLTAAATDFPCTATITEIIESKDSGDGLSGIDSDDSVFKATIGITGLDKAEVIAVELDDVELTNNIIAFANQYWEDTVADDLEIPVYKEGIVKKGFFKNQKFDFEVYVASGTAVQNSNSNDLADLDFVKLNKAASVTLSYPSVMTRETELKFTDEELSSYSDLHNPIILGIVERKGEASNWSYDDEIYYVEVKNTEGNWNWRLLSGENLTSEENVILFQNTYNDAGEQGTQHDKKNPIFTILDSEVPIIDDPVSDIDEISIPEAEIPLTGGLGILAFLSIGGATVALGMGIRKKDKR